MVANCAYHDVSSILFYFVSFFSDHWDPRHTGKNTISLLRRFFEGLNLATPFSSIFALRRRPKKPTKQTAQKVAWTGSARFKCFFIDRSISGVMGIGVRARSDLGGRRPVCPKKLRSAPLLDCRNQLFTPSKCTKKHAFTIVERHKIVRNRNTVFRTSHTLCGFTRSSNDRVTKQATRSSN